MYMYDNHTEKLERTVPEHGLFEKYIYLIQCDDNKDLQTKYNSNRTWFVIRLQCLATNCSSFTAAGMDGDQHMLSAFVTISDMRDCPPLEHELCEMHHHGNQALAVPAKLFDKLM